MKRLLLATTAIVALAIAPAYATDSDDAAQSGAEAFGVVPEVDIDAVGMGDFSADNVDPADPFGEIVVDVSNTSDANAIAGFLSGLTEDEFVELIQRCLVIEANAGNYEDNDVNFCALTLDLVRGSDGGAAMAPGGSDASDAPADQRGAEAFGVVPELDVDAIGMGDFTPETVDPADPFGDLDFDVTATSDANAIAGFLASLTQEQLTELTQRCVVIEANADTYDDSDVNFCALTLDLLRGSNNGAGPDDAAAPSDDPAGDDNGGDTPDANGDADDDDGM